MTERRGGAEWRPSLFQSFFMGGFECASFRHNDGRRLDLARSTGHEAHAASDYLAMQRHGIRSVRDGLRWHRIEVAPGHYDWSSFVPMLRAASSTGTQVVWDLFHYGWPDGLDIWSPAFVDRFAAFCGAVATVVRDETDTVPFYCPVNEISYMSWAAADMGHFYPGCIGRGHEMKRQLVRASVAAIHAIRDVAPDARLVQAEPAIHVLPECPEDRDDAEGNRMAQFQAFDMLTGRAAPELGGDESCLDIVGVNFYSYNQWFLHGRTIMRGEPEYRPLREILTEIGGRYARPLLLAETGAESDRRLPWLRYVCDESFAAIDAGVRMEGLCWYPVTDYPGWDNDRHCDTGLLGYVGEGGARPVHEPLARELFMQQLRVPGQREASDAPDFSRASTLP
jgi:hypothetical protein